jgi:hypothetical protein
MASVMTGVSAAAAPSCYDLTLRKVYVALSDAMPCVKLDLARELRAT